MGVITNIIDALRRRGHPTQKSALKRQDEFLDGQQVTHRWREHLDGPGGPVEAFRATIEPVEESVVVLSDAEVQSITENVTFGLTLLRAFGVAAGEDWALPNLDAAFEAWQRAPDKRGYTNEAVTELLGAMFGHHCTVQLNMRWITVTDAQGTSLAVEGVEREFRGYPYHTVAKRITDRECGFFVPVYALLARNAGEARVRSAALGEATEKP